MMFAAERPKTPLQCFAAWLFACEISALLFACYFLSLFFGNRHTHTHVRTHWNTQLPFRSIRKCILTFPFCSDYFFPSNNCPCQPFKKGISFVYFHYCAKSPFIRVNWLFIVNYVLHSPNRNNQMWMIYMQVNRFFSFYRHTFSVEEKEAWALFCSPAFWQMMRQKYQC